MTERLHFNSATPYESMLAAEHLARYRLLQDACKGKRVLDVACGEGYGSSLLRGWGADEVVGIDISQDAIDKARLRFSAPGISYRTGDACNLGAVLSEGEKFDLIACFETLEHVPDAQSLLRGIRDFLAPGGSIAISCPNDLAVLPGGDRNEFHLRTYTFGEFQAVTSEILGTAVQWQLGTPVLGFGICDATDQWTHAASPKLANLLDGGDSATARFLPAQSGHEVDAQTASFYLGVWGVPLPRTMVAAPIAHRAYVQPWNSWTSAREENSRLSAIHTKLQRKIQEQEDELAAHKRQIAIERRARLQMATKLNERAHSCEARQDQDQLVRLEAELRQTISQRDALSAHLRVLCSSRAHRATQWYYRLYTRDATRWLMRPLRRVAARLRRLIRG